MNNSNQNHTDNFFRQALNSPPGFKPTDQNWKEIEQLLKRDKNRRSMSWTYLISGIAAALLIFFSFWLIPSKTMTENGQAGKTPEKDSKEVVQPNSRLSTEATVDTKSPSANSNIGDPGLNAKEARSSIFLTHDAGKFRGEKSQHAAENPVVAQRSGLALTSALYSNSYPMSSNGLSSPKKVEIMNPLQDVKQSVNDNTSEPDARTPVRPARWGLSLALSPDVNSVKGFDKGGLGLSMGMGISYNVGKAFSVGTGIYYSQKLYSADKTSYRVTEKPFATWTSYSRQINADCKVLDVPLNLTYRMNNKSPNKIYATAGLSSYIMMSEKYEFVYNNPSPAFPTGRRKYALHNQNKHILSVLNLGVALEKPISDQVSLVVQPYAKLPLTGIGQGETDLRTIGLGFRLNYSVKRK